jgi:hypothetical protein
MVKPVGVLQAVMNSFVQVKGFTLNVNCPCIGVASRPQHMDVLQHW